ncbi:MAG: DoxX family protein [Phycisphaerae bacterium]|nr:DoxX family protein [Phycisphaerae bacterium]
MTLSKRAAIVAWTLQLIACAILGQTLFFKFSAAPESVFIFTRLGMEPWGRIGSGVAELVCCVLLLVPRTAILGALGVVGVMAGALLSHVTTLGVVVQDDGGLLFALACVVMACAAGVIWLRRAEWLLTVRRLTQRGVRAA